MQIGDNLYDLSMPISGDNVHDMSKPIFLEK